MGVLAGVFGVLFGVFHGAGAVALLRAPVAARGSGSVGAIPPVMRLVWLGLSVATIAGGVAFARADSVGALSVLGVGMLGVAATAITNGVLVHGRPTVSHHAVRLTIVFLVLAMAAAAVA